MAESCAVTVYAIENKAANNRDFFIPVKDRFLVNVKKTAGVKVWLAGRGKEGYRAKVQSYKCVDAGVSVAQRRQVIIGEGVEGRPSLNEREFKWLWLSAGPPAQLACFNK
jgi:hypothetical protein